MTLREHWASAVGAAIRLGCDLQAAEDAAQEASLVALDRWSATGVPDNPGGWLVSTARHKALDALRRDGVRPTKEALAAAAWRDQGGDTETGGLLDDQLCLIFMCCHPALDPEVRWALTLRAVSGLRTDAIARLFLVPTTTMAQRLVRARRKIRDARIPLRVPGPAQMRARLSDVLRVVYLIFTEGHRAAAQIDELQVEALRLARLLHDLLPEEPEAAGLHALLQFVHARRAARFDPGNRVVVLPDQDRARWHHDEIADADQILRTAMQLGRPGRYQLEAAIAGLHSTAPTAGDTDWREIALLYDHLLRYSPTAVVEANRAVAVAMAEGPAAGLVILEVIAGDQRLAIWPQLHIARAELLCQLERNDEAVTAYHQALALEPPPAERDHLRRRLAALDPEHLKEP